MTDPVSSFSAFVSYASPDRDKAFEIADSLEARGLKCWIAPRNVRPGREYGDEIIRGIENSRCLILVLSEAANESIYVRREAERAVSKRKPIFPIRIEDVLPSPGLELFVSATHWIDAWSSDRVAAFDQIAGLLAGEGGTPPEAIAQKVGARAHRGRGLRRYSTWVLVAAAFVGIVVAVIAANLLSGLLDDGSKTVSVAPPADRPAAADPGHPAAPAYSQDDYVQDAMAFSGVDFGALKKNAFNVSARVKSYASHATVQVEADGKLTSLLPLGKLYYGLNGQKPDTLSRSPTIELSTLGPSALDVSEITIEYRFPDGRKIGPFSYGIDVPAAIRSFYKGKAEQAKTWVTCQDLTCSLSPLRSFLPAVTAVVLKDASAENANAKEEKVVKIAGIPDQDLLKRQFETPGPVLIPGAQEISVVLRYYDGTKSVPRAADVRRRSANTILTELTPIGGDGGGVVPDVYATAEFHAKIYWAFIVDPPKPYDEVYYTLDEGGFFRAKPSYYTKMGFDLGSPAGSDVLLLKFKAPNGKELGPFAYKVDWDALVSAAFRDGFKREADSLIACRYFEKTGDSFSDAIKATSVENDEWWFTTQAKESATACVAQDNVGWVTVRDVQLGTTPDRLDLVVLVRVGPDDIVSGKWDGRQRGHGGADPFSIWHALLPGKHDDIYARYDFRDGTQSDVIRIRTQD